MHKFQKSKELGGYAVARFGYVIPEYTADLEGRAPQDFETARKRFLRRNDVVEKYYMEMMQIESYARRYITHYPVIMWSLFANTLKMPLHIVSEYKYEHNEKYRQKIDTRDGLQKAEEDARVNKLKDELREFIRQDLEKEKQPTASSPSPHYVPPQ